MRRSKFNAKSVLYIGLSISVVNIITTDVAIAGCGWLDITCRDSGVRETLREADPTDQNSDLREGLRTVDPIYWYTRPFVYMIDAMHQGIDIAAEQKEELRRRIEELIARGFVCSDISSEQTCQGLSELLEIDLPVNSYSWEQLEQTYGQENVDFWSSCQEQGGIVFESSTNWECDTGM